MSQNYEEMLKKAKEKFEKERKYPNIILLGTTGSGKSSLINNIFNQEIAPVSDIQPQTQEFKTFKGKNFNTFVNLIDSKGYELTDTGERYTRTLKEHISKMKDEGEKVDIVWFCLSIAKKRLEEIDIKIIKQTLEIEQLRGRVFIVLTKCDEDDANGSIAKEYKKILKESFSNINAYEVTNDISLEDGLELKKLINDSATALKDEDLKESFIYSQTKDLKMKREYAEKAIKKYMILAGGVGVTPIPFSDAAVITPIQIGMIAEITGIYGMRNIGNMAKGLLPQLAISNVGKSLAGNLAKFIPGVGTVIGSVINGGVATGVTYALGKAISEICYRNYEKVLNGSEINLEKMFAADIILNAFKNNYNSYKKDGVEGAINE